MDYRIERFEKHDDVRGQLVVFLKNSDLNDLYKEFGQIYFVTFDKKGIVRGNHYHKEWREWFGVVSGKLEVVLKDVNTNEVVEFVLDSNSKDFVRLEIGPNIVHAFKNITPYASLINYANTEWSSEDTFSLTIME